MVELMGIVRNLTKLFKRNRQQVGIYIKDGNFCCAGYTPLDQCPEIVAVAERIAEMIGSITIYLMANTDQGDIRIRNALSRKVDIDPEMHMTRSTWMHGIVKDMLLDGHGNAIVMPHTYEGRIQNLEPISAARWNLVPVDGSYRDYRVLIDGVPKKPENLLHFVYNPDKLYKWKGQGSTVVLQKLAQSLAQADKTKNDFLSSEWKPSLIVKVDALTEEFAGVEGRQKLIEDYAKTGGQGEPWIIPAEQFEIEQVRPLSLADLAIKDTIELDKRTVAAIMGVPLFFVGIGEYNKDEYNAFVQGKIMAIVKIIMQELTKKLITSESWYWAGNVWSLMDYDLNSVSNVLLAGADRGYVNGDEWRDRLHMDPAGLKEFKVLENYIPYDMSGSQKKLIQEDET